MQLITGNFNLYAGLCPAFIVNSPFSFVVKEPPGRMSTGMKYAGLISPHNSFFLFPAGSDFANGPQAGF